MVSFSEKTFEPFIPFKKVLLFTKESPRKMGLKAFNIMAEASLYRTTGIFLVSKGEGLRVAVALKTTSSTMLCKGKSDRLLAPTKS